MNFILKLKSVSDKFMFYEIEDSVNIGIVNLERGFNIPLSVSSIKNITEGNIDINMVSTILNVSYVVALDRESKLSAVYSDLLDTIHEKDDAVLKKIVSEADMESDDVLASIYGFALATGDIYFYNLLGRALLNRFVNSEDKSILEDAEIAFQGAIDIYDDAEAYYYLSFIASEKEEFQLAYDYARKSLDNNPPDSIKEALEDGLDIIRDKSDIEKAGVLIHLTEFEDALKILEDCSEKSDDVWQKHMYLGEVYAVLTEMPKSINHFKKALELNPSNTDIYSSLGLVSVMVGDYLKAKEIFEAGIKLEPLNTDLLKNLALLYMRISKQELAHDIMENVIKIDPEDREAASILEEIKEKLSEDNRY